MSDLSPLSGEKEKTSAGDDYFAFCPTWEAARLSECGKKKASNAPSIEPPRGHNGAVVGVMAGHLNFRNGKRGGALSVGASFDRPSRARCTRRCARLNP